MAVVLRNIHKTFGRTQVLRDINLEIPTGKMTALLGPSGCGKTTLLRIIAGLENADPAAGTQILFDGVPAQNLSVSERRVGFVFQHYALFRHMTVFENIAFGLRVKRRRERPSRAEIRERVNELLALIRLEGFGERYPDQLSGGQRQRVALARALAVKPRVLLLDEPFGALDAQVRAELRRWLRWFQEQVDVTSVLVTHDQDEALEVADRLVLVNAGKIEQAGETCEVFRHPANEFVMRFLGEVNVFYGRYAHGCANFCEPASAAAGTPFAAGEEVRMLVRPEDFIVQKNYTERSVPARISRIVPAGALEKIELLDDRKNLLRVHLAHGDCSREGLTPGARVFLVPKASRIFAEAEEVCPCDYVI